MKRASIVELRRIVKAGRQKLGERAESLRGVDNPQVVAALHTTTVTEGTLEAFEEALYGNAISLKILCE